jgi:hypothetical protein
MKRYLLVVLFIILNGFCHAQESSPTLKPLTAIERRNYVITIDQNKVSKTKFIPANSKYNYYGKTVLFVPVVLTNNSNDTLKYLTMSCSWEEFYTVDKNNFAAIPIEPCDKNIPKELTLAPHKSVSIKVPVIKIQNGKKFKIGMILIKQRNANNLFNLFNIEIAQSQNKKDNNVIWSNPIELP